MRMIASLPDPDHGQTGFSLVELIVAIVILGVITAGAMAALDGGAQSKTATLLSKMNEVANAVAIYQKATGCVPSSMVVLFDKSQATASHNFCGVDTQSSYGNQGYMAPMPVNGNGVALEQLGIAGGVLRLRQNLPGTTPNNYAVEVMGIGDLLYPLMQACNGIDYSGTALASLPQDFSGGANCVYVTADNAVGMLISRF